MLLGEFESKLGDKNRIAIPKKFREELGDKLILTRGYENCLILADQKLWRDLIRSLEVRPLLSASVRDLKRFLVGGASEIDFDSQGRFVVSNPLKEFASLTKDVMFVGIENWIEVWDKDSWIAKVDSLSKNVADIADRLADISHE